MLLYVINIKITGSRLCSAWLTQHKHPQAREWGLGTRLKLIYSHSEYFSVTFYLLINDRRRRRPMTLHIRINKRSSDIIDGRMTFPISHNLNDAPPPAAAAAARFCRARWPLTTMTENMNLKITKTDRNPAQRKPSTCDAGFFERERKKM